MITNSRLSRRALATLAMITQLLVLSHCPVIGDERTQFFEKRIRPLLTADCAECHTGNHPEGDFRIETLDHLLRGGTNGPVIVPGKPDNSLLLLRLETDDDDERMPPARTLAAREIADFKRWIRDGAIWPEGAVFRPNALGDPTNETHWSFQPLADVSPPEPSDSEWCQGPVDSFIQFEHERVGLKPVGRADKRTLLRRATLDLTGLPPTPADVRTFLDDSTPHAFRRVVQRLLERDEYGERWGRRWLDLARYADTSGDGTDMPVPEARYYRDYVINAFNDDLPFDQFIIEQLAGDILASNSPEGKRYNDQIIATGYLALSRRFGNSKFADMELIIDDTIDTIGRSLLGLSLGCARCHHHKFDPVTTDDYYGLYGYFASTQYPHAGTEHQKERSDLIPLRMDDEARQRFKSQVAWAVSDNGKEAGDARIRIAGDPRKKGDVAPRGFLDCINATNPMIETSSSGRLELARWIGSPDNPLTARVIVNRVWQYHFGRGIVGTPSDFGVQGARPTHPHLLDWLARDFIRHGWSLKHLHKQIMLSAVYQLCSTHDAENSRLDEANAFLWRFNRQRMDAETVRDSILAVSGTLEPGDGGRHPFPPTDRLRFTQGRPFTEVYDHNHRSVYLMTPRLNKHPFLALFDGPDTNKSTAQRGASTVALQALFMMNSAFVKQKSADLAQLLLAESHAREERIGLAYELVLCRPPADDELIMTEDYLAGMISELTVAGHDGPKAEHLAWSSLARALLSSNEFLYID